MSSLPHFCLSIAPSTQKIARPSTSRPTQLCLDLGFELRNREITGSCNSHQSVGVARLSNLGSPKSKSSHNGPESELEYPHNSLECSETPANSKKKGSFNRNQKNEWAMKWESITELKAWLKEKQLTNSIKFILSVKNLLPVLSGFGVRLKAK